MWVAQFYPFSRARQWINSGGLGTMGFGFPSAIGAKRGRPNDVVINFTGDGSIPNGISQRSLVYLPFLEIMDISLVKLKYLFLK